MGTIFDIPTGKRETISTGTVNLDMVDLKAKGMLQSSVTYDATATDQYMIDREGVRRRLFVNTSVEFAGKNEIWLSDTPSRPDVNAMKFYDVPSISELDLLTESDPSWPDDLPIDFTMPTK